MPYIGNTPSSGIYRSKRETYVYSAGSGQVLYDGGDNDGNILSIPEFGEVLVFINGALLSPSNYTVGDDSVTLDTAPNVGTEVVIITELESALVDSYTRQETQNAISQRLGAWVTKTTNFNAYPQGKFFVDTSTTSVTVMLPVAPDFGDEVRIVDIKGTSKSNPITVNRNGKKIMGATENLVINSNRAALGLVYFDTNEGWVLIDK